MRKSIVALLLVCTFLMVGCGSKTSNKDAVTENESVESTVDDQSTENRIAEDEASVESADSESAFLDGTWETVSNGYEYDGEVQPEYYVQFTEDKVNYGHMKDGAFELEYSDDISDFSSVSGGAYKIQAETADGAQYTYQSSESDTDTLEYYGTWDENEYGDTYSGSASLVRSSVEITK